MECATAKSDALSNRPSSPTHSLVVTPSAGRQRDWWCWRPGRQRFQTGGHDGRTTLVSDTCLSCARNTVNEPRFLDDPDHFEACIGKAPAGSSVASRHHRVADVLGGLARSVGYTVLREPPFEDVAVTTTSVEVDPVTGECFDAETIHRDDLRGDLLLFRGDERILVDVTIVRPTAPSHLRHPTLAPHANALATAAAAERAKHAKYDAACERRRWKMVPFAAESYGALGKEARQLLNKLASRADETSAHAFLQHAAASLSVARQAGNAAIAFGGLQRLRTEQLAWELPMSPGLRTNPSRRRSSRRLAHVHVSPLDVSAAFHSGLIHPERLARIGCGA